MIMRKVQQVKGLQVVIIGEIFVRMPKGSTLLRQRTLSLPCFKPLFQSMGQYIGQREGHESICECISCLKNSQRKTKLYLVPLPRNIHPHVSSWKISSGTIQFKQQKVVRLETEVVAHLPAFRFQMQPALSAVVSGYPWLNTLLLELPLTIRGGCFCHVLEAKNLNGASTLPWQVIPSPFRWWTKSHTKSAFVRLYISGYYIFPHPSQFIMTCFSVHHPLKDWSNIIGSWSCRSIVMESENHRIV